MELEKHIGHCHGSGWWRDQMGHLKEKAITKATAMAFCVQNGARVGLALIDPRKRSRRYGRRCGATSSHSIGKLVGGQGATQAESWLTRLSPKGSSHMQSSRRPLNENSSPHPNPSSRHRWRMLKTAMQWRMNEWRTASNANQQRKPATQTSATAMTPMTSCGGHKANDQQRQ